MEEVESPPPGGDGGMERRTRKSHSVTQSGPVSLHLPDAVLIRSYAGFAPGFNHGEGRLKRIERINSILYI